MRELVTDQAGLTRVTTAIRTTHKVAVDTESAGLHPYQGDALRGISITVGQDDWYIPISHPDSINFDVQDVLDALNDSHALQVLHNAPYDFSVLRTHGDYKIPSAYHDTQVGDWLLDENLDHRLKEGPGARYFGHSVKEEKAYLKTLRAGRRQSDVYTELRQTEEWGKPHPAAPAREEARRIVAASKRDWPTFTAADLGDYAMMDTRLTYDIHSKQMSEFEHPSNPEVTPYLDLPRELAFGKLTYKMIATGIMVDEPRATVLRDTAQHRLDEIEAKFEGVNLASTPQMSNLLYQQWGLTTTHRTGTGAMSTNKDALEELEGQHPGIELILEHRSLSKAVGTYFNSLLDHAGDDGRIHSGFNAARTVTGRLSSSDPNLQNIPTGFSPIAVVRESFRAAPGTELWEFDLSQAELRVAAGFANDERLITALEEGRDLHSEVAASIWWDDDMVAFTEAYEAGDSDAKRQRGIGKNINYSFQYGIGPKKMATYLVKGTGLPITVETVNEAANILQGYKSMYPGLTRLMAGLTRTADRLGYIPLHVPGRYRRYKGPGYINRKTYTALNSIVQGGVAEFLKDVMLEFDTPIRPYGQLCLQIHDSLVCELDPGSGPVVGSLLQDIVDQINPFRMRMLWDSKQWGDKE